GACHAGLDALLWPLVVDGKVVGTLYASGFWAEKARSHRLERRLKALGLPKAEALGDVPILTASDRAWVLDVLKLAAREAEHHLTQGKPQGEDPMPAAVAGSETERQGRYAGIVGRSEPMRALFQIVDKVVASDSTVLVQGENGTGKELIARAVHYGSRRREGAFVAQNCSALNDNLLDSELFGHKRGAFTGAVVDKRGLFDLAHGGTFFLDEVGDMTPSLQVKLLRVLQEGTFVPVGDTVTRRVDVRVIAATHRDLRRMVQEGTFREDLYYRLNVISLVVPPLRERRSDIPLLVEHFLERAARHGGTLHKQLAPDALQQMLAYRWPGNIRELENEVERLTVLSGQEQAIGARLLSPRIRGEASPDASPTGSDLQSALQTLERRMLLEGLRRTNWNKTHTARELGISRRNLIRKVDRYNLEDHRDRS
ncbi:MAG: sigma 54-interacting transcriptional regulator, partial [Myxococcota bacterium]